MVLASDTGDTLALGLCWADGGEVDILGLELGIDEGVVLADRVALALALGCIEGVGLGVVVGAALELGVG